jgi:hypothetical protein
VTDKVRNWREGWPAILPMPHPSPRNNIWLKANSWFEADVVPALQKHVKTMLKPSQSGSVVSRLAKASGTTAPGPPPDLLAGPRRAPQPNNYAVTRRQRKSTAALTATKL